MSADTSANVRALAVEIGDYLKYDTTINEVDRERNIQDGLKFLSAGAMKSICNPTAHEPAIEWPISKHDCLDFFGFISFLWHQLDKAQYFKFSKTFRAPVFGQISAEFVLSAP
jgi:hypothetical protein